MCLFIVLQHLPFPPSGQGQASPYHSRMFSSVPSVTLSANITISLKFLCQCFSNLILNPVSFLNSISFLSSVSFLNSVSSLTLFLPQFCFYLNSVSFESSSFQILHCLKSIAFSASILTHPGVSFPLPRLFIASHRFPALQSPASFSHLEESQSQPFFYGGLSAGSGSLFLLKGRLL